MSITGQDAITKFELYKDDTTELSSDEELDLANKILTEIYNDRPWEWLRKGFTGPTTEVGAISLPTDFRNLMPNASDDDTNPIMNKIVVYVGAMQAPYTVIPMAARVKYQGLGAYCYLDIAARKLRFVDSLASGTTVTFDYQYKPADIGLNDNIPLPDGFELMVVHGMAIDDDIIQIFERARSYAPENSAKFQMYMTKLARYNNSLLNL